MWSLPPFNFSYFCLIAVPSLQTTSGIKELPPWSASFYLSSSKKHPDKTDPIHIFRGCYESRVCIIRLLNPSHCSSWLVKGHLTWAEPMAIIPGTLTKAAAWRVGLRFFFHWVPSSKDNIDLQLLEAILTSTWGEPAWKWHSLWRKEPGNEKERYPDD